MTQKVFEINTSTLRARVPELAAGDRVLLTGCVFTARDAAHKKLFELLDNGGTPPFELKDCVIYYAGPTPGRSGMAVGSCGPTTSARMDNFSPRLMRLGMSAMIGKGEVSETVRDALQGNNSVYLCAVGGAGALIARHVKSASEIAFSELGCESIKELYVEKMPLTVGADTHGGNIFNRQRFFANGNA